MIVSVTVPIESWQVWWVMLGRLCVTQASDLPRHTLLTNSDKRIFTTSEGFTVMRFGHRRAFMACKAAPHKYSYSQAPIFTWSMEAIKNKDRFYYSVRKSWRNKQTEINTHTEPVNTHRQYVSPVSAHPFSALSVFTHLPSDILSRPSLLCTLLPFLLCFNTDMHLFSSNTVCSFKFNLCEAFVYSCTFLRLLQCMDRFCIAPLLFSILVCVFVRVSTNSSGIWGWEMWVKWWSVGFWCMSGAARLLPWPPAATSAFASLLQNISAALLSSLAIGFLL